MKQTPKSCGCKHCRIARGQGRVKQLMKLDERAFRHGSKISLNKGEEVLSAAFSGPRYG